MPTKVLCQAREIERQHAIVRREMPERLMTMALGYGLCMVWADPWLIGALYAVALALDLMLTLDSNPRRVLEDRWRYGVTIVLLASQGVLYVTAAGLVWLSDDPFAKAFAVGMVMAGLMHLTTMRSSYLPFGLAGLVGVAATTLSINTFYWASRGDWVGMGLSTAACFGGLSYGLTTMLSNHRLHRSMAVGETVARSADEAKGRFLAQMSHELRTPLNAIIGMAQAELAEARSDQGDAAADRIHRLQTMAESARTLALILDDVTDMDAILRGRFGLRPRVLNLAEELAAIGAAHKTRAQRLGIPFTTAQEGTLPDFVRTDAVRLRQCLGNLLTNAMRHAPQGAVHATCRCHLDASGKGGTLVVDVTDSGPGVPDDQREAIFEAFHKGREAAPGSGLGLAISRALARSMGGDLFLLPREKGAHFRLTLRFEVTGPPQAPEVPPDLTGRLILVVDDVATNRLVAAGYLRPLGARVIEAASGAEALDILATEELDLVLLDMNMPGLDGFATLERARNLGGHAAAVPIVAMTADVLDDQVAAIRRAGVDGYLPKPILPETLAAELSRLLPG
jgi:signal transduction histidine kinase/CheY-like chemotaxis protein